MNHTDCSSEQHKADGAAARQRARLLPAVEDSYAQRAGVVAIPALQLSAPPLPLAFLPDHAWSGAMLLHRQQASHSLPHTENQFDIHICLQERNGADTIISKAKRRYSSQGCCSG